MGYEPGKVCDGQIVESYVSHIEEIELCLVDKSEPMAIFESVLLKINKNHVWREDSSDKQLIVVVQARDEGPVHWQLRRHIGDIFEVEIIL